MRRACPVLLVLLSGCGVSSVVRAAPTAPGASAPASDAGGVSPGDGGEEAGVPQAGPPDAADAGSALVSPGAVNPACPDDFATVIDARLPARMATNTLRFATVVVRNSGTRPWTEADEVRLGSPGDDDPFADNARVVLPGGVRVEPGATYAWAVPLRAPALPGRYLTDWQMVREGVCWFGDRLEAPVVVSAPVATGRCEDPAPPRLDQLTAVVHIVGPTRTTLDSTPKVCDRAYCASIGFTDGRGCCPPRPEGHPDVPPCNEALVGRAADTGRVGPTWTFDGERCGPDGPGNCQNHPDNQFLLWVFGPGTARACGNVNGVCGEVVVP